MDAKSSYRRPSIGAVIGSVILFSLVGLPVGSMVFLTLMGIKNGHPAAAFEALSSNAISIVGAFAALIGTPPAVLTGIVAAFVKPGLPNRAGFVAAVAVTGLVIMALYLPLLGSVAKAGDLSVSIVLSGGAAAALCALFASWKQP